MFYKNFMTKCGKYLMLAAIVGGFFAGTFSPKSVEAAEVSSEIVELLNSKQAQDNAITYVSNGVEQVLPVPADSAIKFSGAKGSITVTIGRQKTVLKNVTDLTLKGVTVSHLIPFYTDSVTNLTLDGVNFQKGIDISGTKGLQTLVVKDSTFGATDYSLAVHGAASLTSYVIDNSSFNADVRIYSNHSLETTTISNSVMADNVSQYSNKRGYKTNFVNNRFEYGRKRTIASGGMSPADIFYVNPNNNPDYEIGASRFDASKPGKVFYKLADGNDQEFDVPAGVSATYVEDLGDKVTIKLSNGQSTVLNNVRSLTFRNVNIDTPVAFTSPSLKLEKLEFINSQTRLIDVAYSQSLQSFKINRSDVSQHSGYVSVYNNKAIKEFVMQESNVKGSSGYISVYNNPTLTDFITNNTYTYGYLSAYNLGGSVLKLSNSKYDDYINTNQIIEGEGGRVVIGTPPTLEVISDEPLNIGDTLTMSKYFKALDLEDGDISNRVQLNGWYDIYAPGTYQLTAIVTDEDDNTVEVPFTLVVQ